MADNDTTTDAPTEVAVTLNGSAIAAKPGELLIDAAERHGVYIPRFCYHNRMKPVGMCRMCLVDVDTGRGPGLAPSCMITVSDGMVVDTESETTKAAQDGILELLLINHPLDCPVCDKGGECPLQDQTMAFGPGETRFVEEKRHYEKPIAISDNVYLDRERCILCDRCTRFAKDVAGDPLIHFMDRGNETQVNTFPDEPFSSYFSGNTVQICPVGALTAAPYRFKARPWDLEEIGSTSTVDSLGSRIVIQSSRNELLRFQGVDSDAVNWSWLSDKDRFSFQAVSSSDRLTDPLVRDGDDLRVARWTEAMSRTAASVTNTLETKGPGGIAVIGGSRLTNEDQYAWAKLAKGVFGTDNVDAQLGDGLDPAFVAGLPRATIDEACAPGGTIIVLGPDPKETLGVLYLRLRHAAVEDKARIIELSHVATGLTPYTSHAIRVAPGGLSSLAAALVSPDGAADGTPAAGIDADYLASTRAAIGDGPITVVLGRSSLSSDPDDIAAAAQILRHAGDDVRFLSALTRGNVHGAIDMGLAPGLLPGRVDLAAGRSFYDEVWPTTPETPGLDTIGILQAAARGEIGTLFLLGADPECDAPDRELVEAAFSSVDTIIALDQFLTDSVRWADVVLPTAGAAECQGTFTNVEGRLSPLEQKVTPPGTARSDWMIAAELADELGHDLGISSVSSIWAEIESVSPLHAGAVLDDIASIPDGVLVPIDGADRKGRPDMVTVSMGSDTPEPAAVATPDAYSLRLVLTRKLFDNGVLVRQSPSLSQLTPATTARLHPEDFGRLNVENGAMATVSSTRGEISVPVVSDPMVLAGTVAIANNLGDVEANRLLDATMATTDVRLEVI